LIWLELEHLNVNVPVLYFLVLARLHNELER
jgi:hypothetical protein